MNERITEKQKRGMEMKHYVVVYNYAIDSICETGLEIIAVKHTLEEAKEIFAERVVEERKYAKENGWEIICDDDTEFDAGEEGNYNAEHSCLFIKEVD